MPGGNGGGGELRVLDESTCPVYGVRDALSEMKHMSSRVSTVHETVISRSATSHAGSTVNWVLNWVQRVAPLMSSAARSSAVGQYLAE